MSPATSPTTPRAQLMSLESLPTLLPEILGSLSISRGQLLLDQLHSAIRNGRTGDLVIVGSCGNPDQPGGATVCAAVIGLLARPLSEAAPITASLLFAGWIAGEPRSSEDRLRRADAAQKLGALVDETLKKRQVCFVQWALDLPEQLGAEQSAAGESWARWLGFTRLGELQYMRLDLQETQQSGGEHRESTQQLEEEADLILRPANHDRRFEELVERTYIDTLDCPALNGMQPAAATLDGYRSSSGFTPGLWFEAVLGGPEDGAAGCLILALHSLPPRAASLGPGLPGGLTPRRDTAEGEVRIRETGVAAEPADEQQAGAGQTAAVLELVYMGVVPEFRGRGLGRRLVRLTEHLARREGCESVLLAVDLQNRPARTAYERSGYQRLMCEEVWGKAL